MLNTGRGLYSMTQLVINVGTAPNDGLGDPIRTAYQKCNTNFSELYSRQQTTPPTSLVGEVGDTAGMYAYSSNYFYYCYANYDGSSTIWGQVADLGNVAVPTILNGSSNVSISSANANVTVSVNGQTNIAVFSTSGANIGGNINATGNITGNNINSTSTFRLAVFANATVRDSSIASPVPGMMIYVTGTGMQVRGATSWNTVAGTGT